jgi:hypothetical protein
VLLEGRGSGGLGTDVNHSLDCVPENIDRVAFGRGQALHVSP